MKKYDNYKDSGIEWIGEIPEHWNINRLRNIADSIKTGSTPPSEEIQYFEPKDINWYGPGDFDDLILYDAKRKISNLSIKENKCRLFPPNSILLIGIGATVGKVGIVSEASTSNQQINAIILKNEYNPKYYTYFISTIKDIIVMEASSATLPIFNQTQTKNIVLPVPEIFEQTTIANYLDHKTTQIDTLIAKKEKFISLLQEERTAVINQAVTKGLDPKVKMKDSGIEWLGEIPEHWEVKKLKYLLKENKDSLKTGPFGSHIKNSDYIPNGNYKVYTQRNVLDNEYENGCESISEEKFDELKGFTIYEGDVLITTRGSIGRCSVFPENMPTGILHPCLIRIQINENLSLRNWIVNYINNTSLFYNNVKFNSNSTIIDVIYGYTLKEIFFPTPSIIEQKKILEFLEVKINEIDTLISKSQQEIELLKEYKTALISEVVTGKVDVRDVILN